MIFQIFNKVIKKQKGSVEIIESALIYPVVLVLLGVILILSLKVINASILSEDNYIKSRNQLISMEGHSGEGIFVNSVALSNSGKLQRFRHSKSKRLISLAKEIYEDMAGDEFQKINLKDIFETGNKILDRLKGKLK